MSISRSISAAAQLGLFHLHAAGARLWRSWCRIADPDYKMERDIDSGKLGGSMYGTVEIAPEQRKPRHTGRWQQLVKATRRATRAFLTLA